MTISNKTLPEIFKFTSGSNSAPIYTAIEDTDGVFHVSWRHHNGGHGCTSYTRKQVESNLKDGWHIVEPKTPSLSSFKFKHVDDEDLIYTATKQPEGDYKITWMSRGLSREIPWLTEELENNIKTGIWNIVEEPLLKCENDANGETSNIPPTSVANIADVSASGFATIYDPISFLMGAMNESGLAQKWPDTNRKGKSTIGELLKAKIDAMPQCFAFHKLPQKRSHSRLYLTNAVKTSHFWTT